MTLMDMNEWWVRTPRDHELLVPFSDPILGPYTKPQYAPVGEVKSKCATGFRRLTEDEQDQIIGDFDDFSGKP